MSVLNVQFDDVKKRYIEKVALCEAVDPYSINLNESMVFDDLPKVTLLDIWNYFIATKSSYSQNEITANKALNGHHFFESGWVRRIVTKRVPNNKSIVVGLVEHTQRINEPPLKPWVLCQSAGIVLAAHCTCLAGLGEACSHVGAILYAVEAMVRSSENQSKTDFACQWNHPGRSTIDRFLPLSEMSFAKTERISQTMQHLEEFTKEEIHEWLEENKQKANVVAPLTLVTAGLNQEFIKQHTPRNQGKVSLRFVTSTLRLCVIDDNNSSKSHFSICPTAPYQKICNRSYNFFQVSMLPKINADLVQQTTNDCSSAQQYDEIILQSIFFKSEYRGMQLQQLLEIATSITVKMSAKNITLIEKLTTNQSDSWLWEKKRVGIVTGSTFKSACVTNIKKPAKSTIMKICYPELSRFSSPQTRYGNKMESTARQMFVELMEKVHKIFSCTQTGLVIDPLCNFFAASPDGTCMCDCCGKYLVEIKCPFCMSSPDSSIENLLKLQNPYILLENNEVQINKNHSYYYQVQMQMAVCRLQLCYFYVWSPKIENHICLKVLFDPNFWQEKSVKAFRFAKTVLVPELMSSYYTKTYA